MVVDETIIDSLSNFKEHLKGTGSHMHVKVKRYVQHVSLDDDTDIVHSSLMVYQERIQSVQDVLEMVAHRPLKDQIVIMANLLTISGFTQQEISQEMEMDYHRYRNILLEVRKDIRGQERLY